MSRRKVAVFLAVFLLVLGAGYFYSKHILKMNIPRDVSLTPVSSTQTVTVAVTTSTSVSAQKNVAPIVIPISTPTPAKPISKPLPAESHQVAKPVPVKEHVQIAPEPPQVEIHKELIPKDIEIVRVYYASDLMGPGSSTNFDINGTGFTKEFEKMITVVSGNPGVEVKNLTYVTLNQIRGTLVASSTCPTSVGFPQILINGKVVFRATDPFAVIRPGEILRVIFTDIGENGRTGRFRIYTNLTDEMFKQFSVVTTTTAIQVGNVVPQLPFIVDATIIIGPALVGEYGMSIKLADKTLWDRPGAIRVVMPKMNESGLIQRLHTIDEFLRPGDKAYFVAQGSGFQPADAGRLKIDIDGLPKFNSVWTFVAPGRMNLTVDIPKDAPEKSYGIRIFQEDKTLLQIDSAFLVVSRNWLKGLRFDPPLLPGATSSLVLSGRDLDKSYVEKISTSFDEAGLKMGAFQWISPTEARAPISATINVVPGDYLLTLLSDGKPLQPFYGNVVTVGPKK